MQNKMFKIFCGIIVLCFITIIPAKNNIVYAASATVSISTSTVTQGDEFEVTVQVTSEENIAGYYFFIEYDEEIIEAISGYDGGGGGSINIADAFEQGQSSFTRTIQFKAKNPGTTSIKYTYLDDSCGIVNDNDNTKVNVSSNDGSVTVNAPVQASSNNNLSSMTVAAVRADGSTYNVELTPGFSKDVINYNIEVEEGVTRLVISANAEDAKASIRTEWAKLDPGQNTTKVIVTAENGERKQYTIYTKVPVPVETTTPPAVVDEPVTVNIGGIDYFIGDINDAVELPEGFEPFEYNYEGKTVVAAKGLVKNLVVMYVTNGDGSAGSLYIYNEEKKTFYRMVNIQMTQKMYTIVEAPENVVIPEGFSECTLNIDEDSFQAWKSNDSEMLYLVYAMNWNGESGLYFYDAGEKQMLKYMDTSVEAGIAINDYNNLLAEKESLSAELDNAKLSGRNSEKTELYKFISFGCGALSIVLLGILIIVFAKKSGRVVETEPEAEFDDDEPEDESEEESEISELEEESEISLPEEESETDEPEEETEENESDDLADEFDDTWSDNDIVLSEEQEEVLMGFEENIEFALKATENAKEVKSTLETEEAVETEDTPKTEDILEAEKAVKTEDILETEEIVKTEDMELEESEESEDEYVEYTVDLSFDKNNTDEPNNRKKVAKILGDENTSIAKDDIDMVIDELFDDLFEE